MTKFKVTMVREPRAVEYNDWDGNYVVPGYALLRSVEPVPVAKLPGAELRQFGHETAFIAVRMPLRDFRRMLGPLRKGDFVDLPDGWLTFQHRWNSDRKQGLCHARISPGNLASFPSA